jgi:gentisate 1,2-dioxygenase
VEPAEGAGVCFALARVNLSGNDLPSWAKLPITVASLDAAALFSVYDTPIVSRAPLKEGR